MSVDAIDTVFLTAIFVLPGFLISGIIDAITPPKKESEGIFFLRCLAYSIINCALWSWLYSIILNGVYRHVFCLWILMTAATVIGASLLAAVLALIKQSEVTKKAIEKLGIKTIHSNTNSLGLFVLKTGGQFCNCYDCRWDIIIWLVFIELFFFIR